MVVRKQSEETGAIAAIMDTVESENKNCETICNDKVYGWKL